MKNLFFSVSAWLCMVLTAASLAGCTKQETDDPATPQTRATDLHPLTIVCTDGYQTVPGQVLVIGKTYVIEAPATIFNQVVSLELYMWSSIPDVLEPEDAYELTRIDDNTLQIRFLLPGEYRFIAESPSKDEPLVVSYRVLAREMEFYWPENNTAGTPFEVFISVWSPEYPRADVSLKLSERLFKPTGSYTFIDKLGPGHFLIWFASRGAFDLEAVITNRTTSFVPHMCVDFFARPHFECITQDEYDPSTGMSWFSNYFQPVAGDPAERGGAVGFNYIYSRRPLTSAQAEASVYGVQIPNQPIQYNLMVKAEDPSRVQMPITFERPDRNVAIQGEPYSSETGNYWTVVYPRDSCYQYNAYQ